MRTIQYFYKLDAEKSRREAAAEELRNREKDLLADLERENAQKRKHVSVLLSELSDLDFEKSSAKCSSECSEIFKSTHLLTTPSC